ncbi:hypothetical protein AAE478_002515 [Parahypoxylon ruwenzoriense]
MTSGQDDVNRFQNIKYGQLGGSNASTPSWKDKILSKIWPFVTGIFTTIAVFLLLQLIIPSTARERSTQEVEDEEWNHCGRSSTIAMSRGCLMEPNFYGWFPSRCVFPELMEKYPVFEDRTWYSDVNLTQEIPAQELWKGKHAKIYTRKIHGEHCLYQWVKLRYGMENHKEFLDTKTFSSHHAKHCVDQLSERCEGPEDKTEVELGFYRCKKTIW